nr:histidine phosphatase family protein [Maricaulis parjimensis]
MEAEFDRPALLDLAEPSVQAALEAADQHVLVVRHARKISPDCNGMSCPLSPQGEAMVARLAELVGPAPVDRAYASAACRTRLTAAAGGREVLAHQAVDGYAVDCSEGETITRQRAEAFAETRHDPVRWTLAGEHSNTSCLWMLEFAGDSAAAEAGCNAEGRLAETAYGDVFWLYRTGEDWHLTVLPGAFEVEAE